MLLVYSVHFKSNRGEFTSDIAKRKEAARQLLAHAAEMERVYSQKAKVVTVIAGDLNTDPTDARFASEETIVLLRSKFVWAWENVPLPERVTNPAKGHYPDACFDGFLRPRSPEFFLQANPHPESATVFRRFSRLQSTRNQIKRTRACIPKHLPGIDLSSTKFCNGYCCHDSNTKDFRT